MNNLVRRFILAGSFGLLALGSASCGQYAVFKLEIMTTTTPVAQYRRELINNCTVKIVDGSGKTVLDGYAVPPIVNRVPRMPARFNPSAFAAKQAVSTILMSGIGERCCNSSKTM